MSVLIARAFLQLCDRVIITDQDDDFSRYWHRRYFTLRTKINFAGLENDFGVSVSFAEIERM